MAYIELSTEKLPDNQYPVYSSQMLDYILKSYKIHILEKSQRNSENLLSEFSILFYVLKKSKFTFLFSFHSSKVTVSVPRITYLLFHRHRHIFTTKFLSFTNKFLFNCYYPGNQLCSVDGRPLRFKLQALYTVRVSWM